MRKNSIEKKHNKKDLYTVKRTNMALKLKFSNSIQATKFFVKFVESKVDINDWSIFESLEINLWEKIQLWKNHDKKDSNTIQATKFFVEFVENK